MEKLSISLLAYLCLLFIPSALIAQDSLRLEITLENFKEKDKLLFYINEEAYQLIPNPPVKNLTLKLKEPQVVRFVFNSRVKSLWVENGNIQIFVPKSNFPKGVTIKGSKSADVWNSLLEDDVSSKISIIEKNIDNPVIEYFMKNRGNSLPKEEKERLLSKMSTEVSKMSKYNLGFINVNNKSRVKRGDAMMDFEARTIDKKIINTESYRGKYLLLDFASTGCGPCWTEYPDMITLSDQYEDLRIITFNQDYLHQTWGKIAERNQLNFPWPILWEAENKREVFERYGVKSWPTFALISPEGVVIETWSGARINKLKTILSKYIKQ